LLVAALVVALFMEEAAEALAVIALHAKMIPSLAAAVLLSQLLRLQPAPITQ